MTISLVHLVQFFLVLVALNLLYIAHKAWTRPNRPPEAVSIALLSIASAIYCLGYAGEVAQIRLESALFWLHVEYFGTPWISALWLLAARQRAGLRPRYALIFTIPVITFVSELTNNLHHFYDYSFAFVQNGPFWVVDADRAPLAWLHLAFLYFTLLLGLWTYLFRTTAMQYTYTQKLVLSALALALMAGYLLYLFGLSPWGLDLAPATLGVTVLSGYLAIFKLGCFQMMPAAHTLVFQSIRDAVIIVDRQHLLVEMNHEACALAAQLAAPAAEAAVHTPNQIPPALLELFADSSSNARIVDLELEGEIQHFDLRVFPLVHGKTLQGYAAILANITSQVQMVRELRKNAETDPLTGVANRRSFLAELQRECADALQDDGSFSLVLFDFDRFKEINDTYGHQAGDKVLCAVTTRIAQSLREYDLLGRLGGDEFAILLPRTGAENATEIAARIQAAAAALAVDIDGLSIRASITVGLATRNGEGCADWKSLFKAADLDLYKNKNADPNRIERVS